MSLDTTFTPPLAEHAALCGHYLYEDTRYWCDDTSFSQQTDERGDADEEAKRQSTASSQVMTVTLASEFPPQVYDGQLYVVCNVVVSRAAATGIVYDANRIELQLPMPMAPFLYTCRVSRIASCFNDTRLVNGRYKALSWTRECLPMRENEIRALVQEGLSIESAGVDKFMAALSDQEKFETRTIAALAVLVERECKSDKDAMMRFRSSRIVKCFTLWRELNALNKFFRWYLVETLSPTVIRSLYWRLMNAPYLLCFQSSLPEIGPIEEAYFAAAGIRASQYTKHLVELMPSQIVEVVNMYENELSREHLVVCGLASRLYERLKTLTLGKLHSYSEATHLIDFKVPRPGAPWEEDTVALPASLHEYDVTPHDIAQAFTLMVAQGGVVEFTTGATQCYQLPQVFDSERGVAHAIYEVRRRFAVAMETKAPDYVKRRFDTFLTDKNARTLGDVFTTASAEQLAVLEHIRESPVTLLDGKAGSGKTQVMAWLMQILDGESVLGTASTSAACDNLMSRAGTLKAFNNHQLYFAHRETCKALVGYGDAVVLPGAEEDLNECVKTGLVYRKCFFENVVIFVVEENSMENAGALAALLQLVVLCGTKLCRLIFIGDRRQLQPMRCGSFWRELLDMFDSDASRFAENHRAIGSTGHRLVENASSIWSDSGRSMVFEDAGSKSAANLFTPQDVGFANRFNDDQKYQFAKQDVARCFEERHPIEEYEMHFMAATRDHRDVLSNALDFYFLTKEGRSFNERHLPFTYYTGRKLGCSKNMHHFGLHNGTIHRIVAFEWVQFPPIKEMNEQAWYLKVAPHFDMQHVRAMLSPTQGAQRDRLMAQCEAMRGGVRVETFDNSSAVRPSTMSHENAIFFVLLQPLDSIQRAREADARGEPPPPPQFIRVPFHEAKHGFRKGACTTVHSYQGRENDHIFVFAPFYWRMLTTEWLYTATTRARRSIMYMTTRTILEKAAANREAPRRCSLALNWLALLESVRRKRKASEDLKEID